MHVSPGSIAQKTISTKPKLKFLTVNNSLSSSKWICTSILLPFFLFSFSFSLSLYTTVLVFCTIDRDLPSPRIPSPIYLFHRSFVGKQHYSLDHTHLRTNQKKFDRFSSSVTTERIEKMISQIFP